jgi:hypothetical protein
VEAIVLGGLWAHALIEFVIRVLLRLSLVY